MTLRALLSGCAAALLLTGCAGYKVGPSNGLEAGAHSIQINPPANQTLEPRLGTELNQQLRKQIEALQESIKQLQAQLAARPPVPPPAPAPVAAPMPNPAPRPPADLARTGTPPPSRGAAPLPPRPVGAVAGAARAHTIQSGETCVSIARLYKVRLDALLAANPGLEPKRMKVGQTIRVPAA